MMADASLCILTAIIISHASYKVGAFSNDTVVVENVTSSATNLETNTTNSATSQTNNFGFNPTTAPNFTTTKVVLIEITNGTKDTADKRIDKDKEESIKTVGEDALKELGRFEVPIVLP